MTLILYTAVSLGWHRFALGFKIGINRVCVRAITLGNHDPEIGVAGLQIILA